MQQQLTEYHDLLAEDFPQRQRPRGRVGYEYHAELIRREPTVNEILKCLNPELADVNITDMLRAADRGAALDALNRALGILAQRHERETRFAPDARARPVGQFHPWVWDAATTLWNSGHHRLAVQAAATAINAHTQAKLGRRDVADNGLMQEAFSTSAPQPGKPRLRCPGNPGDPTIQSRQRGALQYAAGYFAAIRNPATHENGEWDQQVAFEYLAVFSVLARWIDAWNVEKAP